MFCDELRRFRQEKGMTAVEFGKKLGLSPAGVTRNEIPGKTGSFWRYTRKLNKVFGTSFPDVSCCRVCGCDILGTGGICKACEEEKKTERVRKRQRKLSLLAAAKTAENSNLSYGEFMAGVSPRERVRSTEAPEYLELGRTIKI